MKEAKTSTTAALPWLCPGPLLHPLHQKYQLQDHIVALILEKRLPRSHPHSPLLPLISEPQSQKTLWLTAHQMSLKCSLYYYDKRFTEVSQGKQKQHNNEHLHSIKRHKFSGFHH